jgi:hypothetical protein
MFEIMGWIGIVVVAGLAGLGLAVVVCGFAPWDWD